LKVSFVRAQQKLGHGDGSRTLFMLLGSSTSKWQLQMQCGELLLSPPRLAMNPMNTASDVKVLRPKETGKVSTKTGFRRMHEVIIHSGIVSRLDCWRLQASKGDAKIQSLADFAASEPSWDRLKAMAAEMALDYVAGTNFSVLRRKPEAERDQVHENMLLRSQMFLLYEELSYAMNEGDIGRVETCFLPWAYIFQASGKHKYATVLRKYLANIHFRYPKKLAYVDFVYLICRRLIGHVSHAIRMHILVNPTGKPGKFRGVDWWVEHNNLYLKVSNI